jgi:hypothetical protein
MDFLEWINNIQLLILSLLLLKEYLDFVIEICEEIVY